MDAYREHWHALWSDRIHSEPRHAAGRGVYGLAEVKALVADAVAALELKVTDALLDVGCSKGMAGAHLRPLVARYVGLDYIQGFRPTVVGDAARLPFKDGSFDKVLCSGVLMCLPPMDTEPVLWELRRVTRDGGRCLVGSNPLVPLGTHVQWFDPEELRRKALCSGWWSAWRRAMNPMLPQARAYFDMVVEA